MFVKVEYKKLFFSWVGCFLSISIILYIIVIIVEWNRTGTDPYNHCVGRDVSYNEYFLML